METRSWAIYPEQIVLRHKIGRYESDKTVSATIPWKAAWDEKYAFRYFNYKILVSHPHFVEIVGNNPDAFTFNARTGRLDYSLRFKNLDNLSPGDIKHIKITHQIIAEAVPQYGVEQEIIFSKDLPITVEILQNETTPTPGNNGGSTTTPGNNGGSTTTPGNNGGSTTTPGNNGGSTTTPGNNGGSTTTPGNNGGSTTTPGNNGGSTTTPGNNGGSTPTPANNSGSTPTPANNGGNVEVLSTNTILIVAGCLVAGIIILKK